MEDNTKEVIRYVVIRHWTWRSLKSANVYLDPFSDYRLLKEVSASWCYFAIPFHIPQRHFALKEKLSLPELGAVGRWIEATIIRTSLSRVEKGRQKCRENFCSELEIFHKFHKLFSWQSDFFNGAFLCDFWASQRGFFCICWINLSGDIYNYSLLNHIRLECKPVSSCYTPPLQSLSSSYLTIGSWYVMPQFKQMSLIITSLHEINLDRRTLDNIWYVHNRDIPNY